MCSMTGRLRMGTMGLAVRPVSGYSRVPEAGGHDHGLAGGPWPARRRAGRPLTLAPAAGAGGRQAVRVGRPQDADLGDDGGDVGRRRDVEGRVARAAPSGATCAPRNDVTSAGSRSSMGMSAPQASVRSTVESGAAT